MRQLKFSVDSMIEDATRVYVGGRVWQDTIRVGDCFVNSVPSQLAQGKGELPGMRLINLRVTAMLTYGKYMNQVDQGVSAELELEPLNSCRPEVGDIMIGRNDSLAFETYEVLGTGQFHVKAG
jgi:hypothetical protein